MSLRLSHISSHGTCFVELDKPVWNCNFIDKLLSLLSTLASFKSRWQISPAWRSKMGPSERSPHKKWYYFRHFEGYSFWLISLHFCLSMIFCKLFSYVFFFSIVWQRQFEFPWTWRFFLNLNLTSPHADEAWTVFHAHWKPVIHPLLEIRKATCCWGEIGPCLCHCACGFRTSQWDAVAFVFDGCDEVVFAVWTCSRTVIRVTKLLKLIVSPYERERKDINAGFP